MHSEPHTQPQPSLAQQQQQPRSSHSASSSVSTGGAFSGAPSAASTSEGSSSAASTSRTSYDVGAAAVHSDTLRDGHGAALRDMAAEQPPSGSSDALAAEPVGTRREREVSVESQLSVLSDVSSASSGSAARRTHAAVPPPSSWQAQPQTSAGRARAASVDSPIVAAPKSRSAAETASPAASGASTSAALPPAVPPPVRQRATTLRYHGQIVEPDDGPNSSLAPSQSGSQSGGRTPRNSMYAAFVAEVRQPPAAPEAQPPSPRERRRLFGRSKTGFGSSRDSLVQTPEGEPVHASPGRASSLVRRMGSRTFFGGGRNDAAMASTDSLASSTGSAATEGKSSSSLTSKRSGDLLGRTATLPNWVRRKQKVKADSVSAGSAPTGSTDGRSEGRASIESQASVTEFGRRVDPGSREGASASAGPHSQRELSTPAAPDDEPLPRRLSGWLLNMLGTSEAEAARPRAGEPGAPATRIPAARPTVLTHRGSTGSAGSAPSSSPVLLPAGSAAANAGLTGPPAPGSRKAGLLTSLSSSARQRVGNLDRAVRSLREGEVATTGEGAAEEGIWLLGVLHGGSAQQQRRSPHDTDSPPLLPGGPTIEIQGASPNIARVKSGTAPSSSAGRTSETSSLSSGSAPRRRIRETSPGAESAYSSVLSSDGGAEQHDFPRTPSPTKPASLAESNEEAVIVRNPPTPHSSPNPSSYAPRSIAAAVSAAGEYAAATALAAVSGPAPVVASESVAAAFQHDFASRVWCTYRANFAPISRDGSISAQAEAAAAQAAAEAAKSAASGVPNPSTPSASVARNERQGTPASAGTPGQRGWLGRRAGEGGSSADLLSTSPTSPHVPQSPGLGAALGVARAVGSAAASPSTSYPIAGGAGGLGERMGIPSLWGRTTAALSATLGVRSDLTRDSGWGCMLRTGQSLLANALLDVHLGREWRRAPRPPPADSAPSKEDGGRAYEAWQQERTRYATYVRVLSWFFDDPSPACPFGVHRMAREGKRLGKEPGEWFGPSTAAGAIKQLVDDFHGAGIGVSLAADGVVYLSRARKAAHAPGSHVAPHGSHRWQRPVLVLIGVRLGLDGVNPVYHESIKRVFTFPQSVGIAGGRPSSSFYFVGYQGSKLFYLDPHNQRPAVPFRHPPPSLSASDAAPDEADEWWTHVYSEAELSSYHYAHAPKRMAVEGLDPSMLLGFLCHDEASLDDLAARVRALPKPIFSMQDKPPRWMMDEQDGSDAEGGAYDEDAALESFSESSVDAGDEADRDGADSDHEDEETDFAPPRPGHASRSTSANDLSGFTEVAPVTARNSEHAPSSWRGAAALSRTSSQGSLGSASATSHGAPSGSSCEARQPSSQLAFPGASDDHDEPEHEVQRSGSRQRRNQAPPVRQRARVETGARRPPDVGAIARARQTAPDVHAAAPPLPESSSGGSIHNNSVTQRLRSRAAPASEEQLSDSDVTSTWEQVGAAPAAAAGPLPPKSSAPAPRYDDSDDDF